MNRPKIKFTHYLLGCLAATTVCTIVLELGCRLWIVSQPPTTLRLRNGLPQFEFADSVPSAGTATIGSKREVVARADRADRIAIVGDAVAACTQISDSDCFTEKLQTAQTRSDIYNFGVPGYGLPEVEAIVDGIASSAKFSTIVYIANVNDVVDSMPLLLSLRRDPKYRFATYEDFDRTPYAGLWALARDYFKAAVVLHHFASQEKNHPTLEAPAHAHGKNGHRKVASEACASANLGRKQSTKDWFDKKSLEVLARIYADEKVTAKVEATFDHLAASAKRGGLRLVVVPFYNRELLREGANFFEPAVKRATTRSGIELVDSRAFFAEHENECDFYLDEDGLAFAAKGSERFAGWIEKNVLARPPAETN